MGWSVDLWKLNKLDLWCVISSSKLQGLNLEPAALPVKAKTGLTSSTMEAWITRGLPGIGWSHAVAMIRPVSSEQRAPLHDSGLIWRQWIQVSGPFRISRSYQTCGCLPVRPVGVEATRIILAIIARHVMLHVMGVERQAIMEKYVETMTDVTLTSFVTGISLARVPNLVGRKMLGNVPGFMTK